MRSRHIGSRIQGEHIHYPVELAGLCLGLLDGGIGLFHQGRIVLGHFIQRAHRHRNLVDRRCLLAAGLGNGLHQAGIFIDRIEHRRQLLGSIGD
ncbi:hypothetical protein D9M68_994470 [compost metagenome]